MRHGTCDRCSARRLQLGAAHRDERARQIVSFTTGTLRPAVEGAALAPTFAAVLTAEDRRYGGIGSAAARKGSPM